ncbi:putative uncharacterized protein [Clostridium sp. CAG:448]|nr:putative uncharacterized protein [Clostridium sp. CAG:448]
MESKGAIRARLIIWSVVAAVLILVFAITMTMYLTGTGLDFLQLPIVSFGSNYSSYNAGNGSTDKEIRNLDIDWASGEVHIIASESAEQISFEESYDGNEDARLRWVVDGETLKIRFRARNSLISFGSLNKKLTVTIPASLAQHLDKVKIGTASAEVNVSGLQAEILDVDTASGRLELDGTYGELSVDTASGSVTFAGSCRKINIDTASGRIRLTPGDLWEDIDIDTASGNIELWLPESEKGFSVDYDKASGKFSCDFPVLLSGKIYKIGEGAGRINVDSASGNLKIYKAE